MQFLFIIIGFHILQQNIKAITCQIQQVQTKISCHQYYSDCFILEGNEEDYYKLKSIDKEIVQKSFNIPYNDIPIQTKVFKFLDYGMIQEKLICSLFLNFTYYITCISFDTLDYENNNGNLKEKIRLKTNISQQEACDEILQLNESFIIFCQTQFNLKQYSVSLLGDVVLLLEYDVTIYIQDKCKMKQYNNFGQNSFIIVFYQCTLWTILQINNQQIRIIFNSKMSENSPAFFEFSKIDDVQFCNFSKQLYLYLIEGNNYLQIIQDSNYQVIYQFFKSENLILKIIQFRTCKNVMLITYLGENNSQAIQNLYNEIVLNYSFKVEQIHYFANLLFISNQTELMIRIDNHLIQTSEILNSSLNFIQEDNLFYQRDKSKSLLQFYRYFPFSSVIEPKQKFLYFLRKTDGSNKQELISCLKMQYENSLDERTQQQQIFIQKNCENKQEIILHHESFQSLQKNFSFDNNQNQLVNLSIWNDENGEILCYQSLTRYNFKGKIQLISMKSQNFIVFQVENLIYLQNCEQKKIQMTINTSQIEVFQDFEDYYLIDKINKQIKVVSLFQGIINYVELYSNIEIIRVQKFSQHLIIYVKNEKLPIVMSKKFSKNNKWKNYLSLNLYYPQQILYYKEFGNYKFIHYSYIFASEFNKEEVMFFHISDVIIVFMKTWLNRHLEIWAVQNQTNSIILYHFDFIELHQFYNYTLQDYQFYYPLQYDCSQTKFAILVKQNQSLFIALISFTDTKISLIDFKSTDDIYFQFLNNTLVYFNNGELRKHYLNELIAYIEINLKFQQHFISSYQQTLIPTYDQQDKDTFEFIIQNECHNLLSLKNSISLRLQKNQNVFLKLSEYFKGPINTLTIQGNPEIKLRNPFEFVQEIKCCKNETFFCIKKQNINNFFLTQKMMYQLSTIILEDKTIFQIQQPNEEDSINQVFFIQDNLFLWFSQLQGELIIQLLQCKMEDYESCIEIQTQIIKITIKLPLNQNIIKTNNVFKLQDQSKQIYVSIKSKNFSIIYLKDFNYDIKYIEKSQDQYVTLQRLNLESDLSLKLIILSINCNGSYEIFSQIINNEIQNILPPTERIQEFNLVLSQQNANVTIVQCLLSNQLHSFMIKLQIDVQKKSILSFNLVKQIRNPSSDFKFTFLYLDEKYLVLNQPISNAAFFYDFQEDRPFYDYIYRLDFQIQIIKINTTHFIFQNQSQIHLGIIQQYEIELQNINDLNQEFILFAQNDVSDAQILIQIQRLFISDDFNKNILMIQLINQVVIVLYLRNKEFRKTKRKTQNQLMEK